MAKLCGWMSWRNCVGSDGSPEVSAVVYDYEYRYDCQELQAL